MRAKSIEITTDGAGAATADLGVPSSKLLAIRVSGSTMTGGTINITNAGRKILDAYTANVNSLLHVRELPVKADGTTIAGAAADAVLHGKCAITVAGAGANKTATITVMYE